MIYFLVLALYLLPPFSELFFLLDILGDCCLQSWFLQSLMKRQIVDRFGVHGVLV